jgi:hypothetical protein
MLKDESRLVRALEWHAKLIVVEILVTLIKITTTIMIHLT